MASLPAAFSCLSLFFALSALNLLLSAFLVSSSASDFALAAFSWAAFLSDSDFLRSSLISFSLALDSERDFLALSVSWMLLSLAFSASAFAFSASAFAFSALFLY